MANALIQPQIASRQLAEVTNEFFSRFYFEKHNYNRIVAAFLLYIYIHELMPNPIPLLLVLITLENHLDSVCTHLTQT